MKRVSLAEMTGRDPEADDLPVRAFDVRILC
jgi:hypothetical protein